MTVATVAPRAGSGRVALEWLGALALGALLTALALHAAGVVLDLLEAIGFPYQLDPGEGYVWFEARHLVGVVPGVAGLPGVPVRDPPVYLLAARAASLVAPDLLAAGRLVSALSVLAIAPLVAALVVTAGRHHGERLMARHIAVAIVCGLLALCLQAVRSAGMVMRVDALAVALGLAGVLFAVRANGRVPGTITGLLLCLAAVFANPAQFTPLMAVVVVVSVRRPRKARIAGAVALAVGVVALAALEIASGGTVLAGLIARPFGRPALQNLLSAVSPALLDAPIMLLMLVAAALLALVLWRQRAPGPRLAALRQGVLILKLLDPTMAARAVLLLQFAFASMLLVLLLRPGSGAGQMLDWLTVGCVLIGVMLCDLLARMRWFVAVVAVLLLGVLALPFRQWSGRMPLAELERQNALLQRIEAAGAPVASEELTLLMRADRPVPYEPLSATIAAEAGRWDQAALVQAVQGGRFAFVITIDDAPGGSIRRAPAVDAAMRAAYPVVERAGARLWVHLPR